MSVCVVSSTNKLLMPTSEYKARRLINKGRAEIYEYHPFTIRMLDRDDGDIQPIEYCCDTGARHVGVSIKSQKHEYVHAQYDVLYDEKQRHDDQRRYRRTRRNRKRYRKPRFDNRRASKKQGWIAPSLKHIEEAQIRIFEMYKGAMPIVSATFEVGKFDTMALAAIEKGETLPQGKNYQQGIRYQHETLRKAVFTRDGYKCICCGRTISDNVVLCLHHLGFKTGDHTDRMDNLATVCSKCHTSKNHKEGGALYDLEPKINPLTGAAFMNTIRWDLVNKLMKLYPSVNIRTMYGAKTSVIRKELHLPKTHANDAYAMGEYHPRHRSPFQQWQKQRRNDRRLQKFYDAKYVDIRDGKTKKGQQLASGRTKRGLWSGENLRIYRGKKVSKGHNNIRRYRTMLKPNSIVEFEGERLPTKGTHIGKNGTISVEFAYPTSKGRKCVVMHKVKIITMQYTNAWRKVV